MRGSQAFLAALLAMTGLSLGCASVPGDSGFHEVQEAVHQRTGFRPSWIQRPADEEPVKEKVQALLQKELNAEGAAQIALLNNRRLQAALEELNIARADLVQAGLVRNPLLFGEIRFPANRVAPFELSLVQNFLDLFQLRLRRSLAAAAFEPAKLRVANEVLNQLTEVRSAFYALQGEEQMAAFRKTVAEAARASAEVALRQHEAGNLPDLQLENEQALLEQAKLDHAQSEVDVLVRRERVNALLGLWGSETNWKIASNLPDPPPREPELEGIESLAVSQRLDLAVARQEVEVAARALPLARSGAIGEITAGAHHEKEPEGTKTTGPAVEVPLPIFNRGRAARARAEALLRQTKERYTALAVEVRSEVRAARSRALAARSRVDYYWDVILPRRRRIVEQTQLEYNAMFAGVYQLLQAKQSEITARREYIEALRDYWVGRSELERAAGGRLPVSVTSAEPSSQLAGPMEEPGATPLDHHPPAAQEGKKE